MGSKVNNVIVLLPNGRRQTLKVNLDSSVLQILEDVCSKHEFDSNEYALKHHNTVLDPASVVRFCGLPNNAALEMVPNKKSSQNASNKVTVSLQVDKENDRFTGEFSSQTDLEHVLSNLYPKAVENADNQVPVVVYMRREIVGFNALKGTTLRSLGLTSGRALFRVTMRDSVEHPDLKCTGNSVLIKPVQNVSTQESAARENPVELGSKFCSSGGSSKLLDHPSHSLPAAELDDVIVSASTSKIKKSPIPAEGNESKNLIEKETIESVRPAENIHERKKPNEQLSQRTLSPVPMDVDVPTEKKSMPEVKLEDVKFLDQHNGLVFPLEDSTTSFRSELPDSFFDITLDDLKLMMRDLKRSREIMENAPLRTEALRQSEIENRIRIYEKTVVRVQFPDRFVLQGVFHPNDIVADVESFVRNYINETDNKFYLYTSPPKKILAPECTLLNVDCVPCAKIYFAYVNSEASDFKCFLHDKVKPFITTQQIATAVAAQLRGISDNKSVMDNIVENEINKRKTQINSKIESTAATSVSSSSLSSDTNQLPAHKQDKSNSNLQGKVPKWFKPL